MSGWWRKQWGHWCLPGSVRTVLVFRVRKGKSENRLWPGPLGFASTNIHLCPFYPCHLSEDEITSPLLMDTPMARKAPSCPQASTNKFSKLQPYVLFNKANPTLSFTGHVPVKAQTWFSWSNFQLLTCFALALRLGMEWPERLRLHPVWVEEMPKATEARLAN